MTPVCRLCKHLMPEGKEDHICPDQSYTQAHDRLIAAAAIAEEILTPKELESVYTLPRFGPAEL